MGNAAVLLKKRGHEVAGSDAGVYPPMSDVLSQAGITLFEGFSAKELREWNPDRVVVGNAAGKGDFFVLVECRGGWRLLRPCEELLLVLISMSVWWSVLWTISLC